MWAQGQAGVAPKVLFEAGAGGAQGQVQTKPDPAEQVSSSVTAKGLEVHIKGGAAGYPGIGLKPAEGKAWDLSLYGHVEAKVTNTGTRKIDLAVRVDNDADWKQGEPFNCESKSIDPGQTETIRVFFGYSYGFHPSYKLNPAAVVQVLFFTGKTSDELSFRIERVQGAGWVGEKPGDPARLANKPAKGILLDTNTKLQPGQVTAGGAAKASAGADGKSIRIEFAGGQDGVVTFRPAQGLWNLNEHVQVKVKLKNTGQTPVKPAVRVESEAGPTDLVTTSAPLAPGAAGEIVVPFAAKVPWKGEVLPAQLDGKVGGTWHAQSGTGTEYRSNRVTGITFLLDKSEAAKSLVVTSIVADRGELKLPEWLGKRPPVPGEWVQTLNEEFNGNSIDLRRWNVQSPNWWDKRMHFSKDQVIVKDGVLRLRMEKKPGYHNDDPKSGPSTPYATGQIETYGKWTQRYGYFEVREKQPAAPGMWPGFWMMPDRGVKAGEQWKRADTGNHGMEFDITESQSSWGVHRFNVACHWDGYGKEHKSIGTSSLYVQADKDGYIVVGLLWTPGSYVVYGNGKEIFRWESPRISNQQANLIVQNQLGGWDNEDPDDAQLPADFVVDYIRVWQRKDLATPEDGAKKNGGGLDAPHAEGAAGQ
jgi:beta-glucanase (GH16 family)